METVSNLLTRSADGRKRVEHLTSKRGLISIFDDWGLQRLILESTTKSATVYESLERSRSGLDLEHWIRSFQTLTETPAKELGQRELFGKPATGFSVRKDNCVYEIWVNEATGEPMQIEIDSPMKTRRMFDIQYHEELDGTAFGFDVPKGYTEVERRSAPD